MALCYNSYYKCAQKENVDNLLRLRCSGIAKHQSILNE